MDELFKGTGGTLGAICVIVALQLVVRVGEFLWQLKEKKDRLTETGIERLSSTIQESTIAIQHLESKIKSLESTLGEFSKFKLDMRRLFTAVKRIAGSDWAEIRKEIMEDETTQ